VEAKQFASGLGLIPCNMHPEERLAFFIRKSVWFFPQFH
jgi:hypothetical protein